MKKLFIALVLMTSVACTSSTQYGDCIGVLDKKESDKEYSISFLNVFLGVLFSETIIVPGIVLLKETYCPVDEK